jgi:hypothetical protein
MLPLKHSFTVYSTEPLAAVVVAVLRALQLCYLKIQIRVVPFHCTPAMRCTLLLLLLLQIRTQPHLGCCLKSGGVCCLCAVVFIKIAIAPNPGVRVGSPYGARTSACSRYRWLQLVVLRLTLRLSFYSSYRSFH